MKSKTFSIILIICSLVQILNFIFLIETYPLISIIISLMGVFVGAILTLILFMEVKK